MDASGQHRLSRLRHWQHRHKTALVRTVIGLALLAATLSLPIFQDPILNSWRLSQMAGRIQHLDHPAGTRHLLTHARVGLQVGNGNHCDYFVAEVRTFEIPRDALKQHYASQTFTNPVSHNQDDVQILFLSDGLDSADLPDEFANLSAWDLPQDVPLDKLYALVVFDSYDANADIRCH